MPFQPHFGFPRAGGEVQAKLKGLPGEKEGVHSSQPPPTSQKMLAIWQLGVTGKDVLNFQRRLFPVGAAPGPIQTHLALS